jgi:hypothetical protein
MYFGKFLSGNTPGKSGFTNHGDRSKQVKQLKELLYFGFSHLSRAKHSVGK